MIGRKEKRILLIGDIEAETIKPIIEEIYNTQEEAARGGPVGDIDLHISSTGGYVGMAIALCSVMESINLRQDSPFRIHTTALREIYSSAMYIWLSGFERRVTKYSGGILHASTGNAEGSFWNMKDQASYVERETATLVDLLKRCTVLEEEDCKEILTSGRDYYYDKDELLWLIGERNGTEKRKVHEFV